MTNEVVIDAWVGWDDAVGEWNKRYNGSVENIKYLFVETNRVKKTRVVGSGTAKKYKLVR